MGLTPKNRLLIPGASIPGWCHLKQNTEIEHCEVFKVYGAYVTPVTAYITKYDISWCTDRKSV